MPATSSASARPCGPGRCRRPSPQPPASSSAPWCRSWRSCWRPPERIAAATTLTALLVLAGLGALAAWAGGASRRQGALRMLVWGALAMGLTAAVGRLFGTAV
ncbi:MULTISPECIES: VIT1/CCC1 transporter family protein [Aphanothece]|uniref:VIT1/CCC1 transporter family protein n=1 Tax=Aphanothece TaxID=1121 RepID=UPI0039853ADD